MLNLLIHIFLSKTRILPFSGDLCTLLNGHFHEWPQNDSKKSKNDRHLLREKRAQKCRFWVEKVEISNELLKMHTKGQNKLTKKSKQKFSFLVKFCRHFWANLKNVAPGPLFEKVDFGDFSKAPAPPCVDRLS